MQTHRHQEYELNAYICLVLHTCSCVPVCEKFVQHILVLHVFVSIDLMCYMCICMHSEAHVHIMIHTCVS